MPNVRRIGIPSSDAHREGQATPTGEAPSIRSDGRGAPRPLQTARWLGRWCGAIVFAYQPRVDRFRRSAWVLRILTFVIAIGGLVLGVMTKREIRRDTFTPLPFHVLVVITLLTFSWVGFWLLCRKERGSWVLGWIFEIAAFIGSIVYLAATFGVFAMDRGLAGGTTVGWIGDLLFLPAIAALLPLFLTLMPTGDSHGTRWRPATLCLAALAAPTLLLAMLFEPHLFSYARAHPPLAHTWMASHANTFLTWLGLGLLLGAVASGVGAAWARAIHDETSDGEWDQLKWYLYGAIFAVAALVPYLVVTLAGSLGVPVEQYVPRASSWVRAWGSLAVAALAIAAIPATVGQPWRHGRIRRLVWGAVIAAFVAGAHEFGVISVAERIRHESQPHLGSQLLVAYGVALGIAIAFEPVSEWFRAGMERVPLLRASPGDLLEEAGQELRACGEHLMGAHERAEKWRLDHPPRTAAGKSRWRLRRQRVLEREVADALVHIRRESELTASMLGGLEKQFGRLEAIAEEMTSLRQEPNGKVEARASQ